MVHPRFQEFLMNEKKIKSEFISSDRVQSNLIYVSFLTCMGKKRCTRLAAASDKVYQLLAHGRWFSPGTPASSTTKNWSPWYSWNIVESGVKHNKSNQIMYVEILIRSWNSKLFHYYGFNIEWNNSYGHDEIFIKKKIFLHYFAVF